MNNDQLILSVLTNKLGSADWSKWQIQRWTYFDYVRYPAAGTNSLSFFANAIGSTDPVSTLAKTMEQTNLQKPRTFGQQYYIIRQIRTHLNVAPKARQTGTTAATTDYSYSQRLMARALAQLAGLGVFQMKIGQKDYFDIEQPFKFCPPGFGLGEVRLPVASDGTAGEYDNAFVQQSNDVRDIYALTPPQLIEPEQTFEVTIDFPYANSPALTNIFGSESAVLDVGVIFDGYIARPAQ